MGASVGSLWEPSEALSLWEAEASSLLSTWGTVRSGAGSESPASPNDRPWRLPSLHL